MHWKWFILIIVGFAIFSLVSAFQLVFYFLISERGMDGLTLSKSGGIVFEPAALISSILVSGVIGITLAIIFVSRKGYLKLYLAKNPIKTIQVLKWIGIAIILLFTKELVFRSTGIENGLSDGSLKLMLAYW